MIKRRKKNPCISSAPKISQIFWLTASGKSSVVEWKSFWDKLVDFIANSNLLSRSTMFGQDFSLHTLRRSEERLNLCDKYGLKWNFRASNIIILLEIEKLFETPVRPFRSFWSYTTPWLWPFQNDIFNGLRKFQSLLRIFEALGWAWEGLNWFKNLHSEPFGLSLLISDYVAYGLGPELGDISIGGGAGAAQWSKTT